MIDFLIAGVQKGGTTALHSFLSQHPEVYLPPYKEVHFFDDESLDWRRPDYNLYHHHFRDRQASQIAGEATPIYSFWVPAAERIHRYDPTIKLIFLLRNPVERCYSHWAMEFGRNTEVLNFTDAIRTGRSRVASGQHRIFSYVERGFYSEQIERFQAIFPARQMLFLKTDELAERHEATLDRVCDFIGVGRFREYPPATRVLPAARVAVPAASAADMAFLGDLFSDDMERTEQQTGLDLAAWR